MKILKYIAIIAVVIYSVLLFAVFIEQRNLIYLPPAGDRVADVAPHINDLLASEYSHDNRKVALEQVTLQDNTTINFLYLPPANPTKPVLVAALGNAHSNHTRLFYTDFFAGKGFGVLILGYPGFGGNTGSPSEKNFYAAARAQINWLQKTQSISLSRIALFGQSLGSGPATQMASEFKTGCLILESPFTSATDVAAERYPYFPARYLIWDHFDNLQKIKNIHQPTFIYQGTDDMIVPPTMGPALFAASPAAIKKGLWVSGAGHNDLADFTDHDKRILDIDADFVAAHTGEN